MAGNFRDGSTIAFACDPAQQKHGKYCSCPRSHNSKALRDRLHRSGALDSATVVIHLANHAKRLAIRAEAGAVGTNQPAVYIAIANQRRADFGMKFTDENIEKLLGKSDAENESSERLKEYFYKNKAYENLNNSLAIRILVGHKGSGKSALLRMLYIEDTEKDQPAIFLQPGNILDAFDKHKREYNSWVEDWKKVLNGLIVQEALKQIAPDEIVNQVGAASNTSDAIIKFIKKMIDRVVSDGSVAIEKDIVNNYIKSNSIRVYIDDLDRGWKATIEDVNRISTLLSAVRDLCGSSNAIQFRIALRSDVYNLVRTSDESTDKVEDKIVSLKWTAHDLLIMFAKRINTYFGESTDERDLINQKQDMIALAFDRIIESKFQGRGKWNKRRMYKIILSLQRNRPRDIVKLLSGAAKAAYSNGHDIISTGDIESTFVKYSTERLQDVINEFKSEMPEIERLLIEMKPSKKTKLASESFLFDQSQLDAKLKNVIGHVRLAFSNKKPVDPRSLGEFLYKTDFIVARKTKDDGLIVRAYFDENRFLADSKTDFGFSWEIHPAYRWALEPEGLDSLYDQIAEEETGD